MGSVEAPSSPESKILIDLNLNTGEKEILLWCTQGHIDLGTEELGYSSYLRQILTGRAEGAERLAMALSKETSRLS